MSSRDKLGENLDSGKTSLGVYISSVEWVELAAHLGFDWFLIDHMHGGLDWAKTLELVRAGEAYDITPAIRVQSYPWGGYDPRIAADVARAFSIGAQYVLISNSGKKEIEDAAAVSHDWHRRNATVHPFDEFGQWDLDIPEIAKRQFVIPQPESVGALNELEETLAIPEVKLLFFAMTDASKELQEHSNKPDWYLPELWEMVDGAVKTAGQSGKFIGANTSYAYDMAELQKRTLRLHERGVKMIMIQGATFLFQIAVGAFLRETKRQM